ncbi:cytochrome P450 [Chroococcidiopsis sp.]|uniref:cytochrome P450 n=1 Tax=Chroococcidiopsis sp. TaxID=3088168 RepID=UPI003F2A7230
MKSTINQSLNPDSREGDDFFLNHPQKLDNPFPDLQYFRENHPVFFYSPLNQWFVFKYDDVAELFSDSKLSPNRMKGFVDVVPEEVREEMRQIVPYLEMWVLAKDGQDHARLHDFLHLGFNAAVARGLKQQTQKSANDLLDRVEAQGYMDGSGDYGFLLTAYVLSDFLGVRQEDRHQVIQWSVDFVDFFNIIPITADMTRRLVQSANGLIEYTRELIAQRRVKPQDDFLSTLVKAQADRGQVTDDEIVANAMLILLAGHLAVRNLIGNAIYLLLTHPEQRAKLQSQPELLANAIQEVLRYEPPVILIPRVATEDFEFHGQTIRNGQIVQLSIASANRDSDHFHEPDRFDISRNASKALSFGHGPHSCLGAVLAKQEAVVALENLFRRMPNVRLDESQPIKWYRNAGNRGPEILPLIF